MGIYAHWRRSLQNNAEIEMRKMIVSAVLSAAVAGVVSFHATVALAELRPLPASPR